MALVWAAVPFCCHSAAPSPDPIGLGCVLGAVSIRAHFNRCLITDRDILRTAEHGGEAC
jgi:hypothetical protein